jgi:alpha-amylase/alpha-mannosidase (GH57 family)
MDRYICIHGHFYQPPRENPWLEAVETQDSAHPYHDWNERIAVECYAPNASARILDVRDRIVRIVNNYAWISFNFGPTLLSWLERHARDTYAAILDADAQSRARFSGHGSAIAQVYNHVILPLANERDQRTQVRWGVRDFETRFRRRPEGMWLPETAVDIASLEALVDEGIRFTILEPHQAARYREIGKTEWIAANASLDPTRPYLCNLPSGRSIAIFFYDGPISRAVAFEKLLARGEHFAHRLVGAFSETRKQPQLVNIATDGETYGHHHRFGDMALAYALQYIEENKLARITNYGEFLELHPPLHEVEIVENTAWSCAHGVERWRSDCGCHTGAESGWNQQWRAPLRKALDWLRDEVSKIYEDVGGRLIADPWRARDDYVDVILDRDPANVARFLSEHAPGADRVTVLELLEMQRNAMLMYTSCGWFFNDVSGIETVQVLHYAGRVAHLAEKLSGRSLDTEFSEQLSTARSNLPAQGTARQIYEREVIPSRLDLRRVAAHYAVSSLFDNFREEETIYSCRVVQHHYSTDKAGRARMALAAISVLSLITHETGSFDIAALHLGETELTGGVRSAMPPPEFAEIQRRLEEAMEPGGIPAVIRLLDQHFHETPISIRSLFRDEQRRILRLLCNTTLEEAESAFRQLHQRYDPLMRFHTRLGIPLPKVLQTAAEFDLNLQLRRLLEEETLQLDEIESRLREAREEGVALDDMTFMTLKTAIERAADAFRDDPADLERLKILENLISLVRGADLHVNMRRAQNDYYRMKSIVRPRMVSNAGNGSSDANRWLELFDSLGDKLLISPEART